MALDETANLDNGSYVSGIDGMVSSLDRLIEKQEAAAVSAQKMSQPGQMSGAEQIELFGSATEKAGQQIGTLVEHMTGLSPAALASGAALVEGGKMIVEGFEASIEKAGAFEESVNKVGALTGEATTGLKAMAEEASKGTTVGLDAAGQAMISLADNGIRTADMEKTLAASITLSEASTMNLNSSTGALSQTMLQFHLDGTQAAATANTFVAASQKGKTSTEDLVGALRTAGPVAAGMGLSFDTTAAALSLMTGEGIRARTAGTDLVQILTKFETPNKAVAEGLKEIGLSASDVDPRLHSLADITETLKDHNLTAADATSMFGQQVGTGLMAVVSASGGFNAYTNSISNTQAATEGAEKASSGYDASMKKLDKSIGDAETDLGTLLLPALADFVTVIAQAISGADSFGKALATWSGDAAQETVKLGQAAGNAIKPAMNAVDRLLGNDPNTVYNVNRADGLLYAGQMGTAEADAYYKAYGAQLQSDTSENDPIVEAAMKRQAEQAGKGAGTAAADAFSKNFEEGVTTSSGLAVETLWNAYGAAATSMIANFGDRTSYGSNQGKPISNDNNKSMAASSGQFQLGEFLLNEDTGASAWQLRTQRWGQETLDPKDPIGDANRKMKAHIEADGKKETEQFGTAATGEPIVIPIPISVKADYTVTTDSEAIASGLKDSLEKQIEAVTTSGSISVNAIKDIQDNYKKIFAIDPSMVNELSGKNIQLLSGNMTKLTELQDKLNQENADHAQLSAADYWTKYNDTYEHGRQNLIDQMGTTTKLVKAETDKMTSSLFEPTMLDPALYHTTEWKDAGTKIGTALANGAIDSLQEQDILKGLRDQFAKEGDTARTDLMNHILAGDWSLAQIKEKGKELGMSFENGVKEALDMFGNIITDVMKDFDLTAFLKNPDTQSKAIGNMKDFAANVFEPTMKKNIDDIGAQLDTGLVEAIGPAADYINNLVQESMTPIGQNLFTLDQLRALDAYKEGLISLKDVYDALSGKSMDWVSKLDTQSAAFAKHQVAFDINYGLNQKGTPYQEPTQTYTENPVSAQTTYYSDFKEATQPIVTSLTKVDTSISTMTFQTNTKFDSMIAENKTVGNQLQTDRSGWSSGFSNLASQDATTNQHLTTIASNTTAMKSQPSDTSQFKGLETTITTGFTQLQSLERTNYSGLLGQNQTQNTHLTAIQTSLNLINSVTLPGVRTQVGLADTNNNAGLTKGFTGLETALATDTGNIVTSVNSASANICAAIVQAAIDYNSVSR